MVAAQRSSATEQAPRLGVLLIDECECGAGADHGLAHTSLSSIAQAVSNRCRLPFASGSRSVAGSGGQSVSAAELFAGFDVELAVAIGEVHLDGAQGDGEGLGDLLVGVALGGELDDAELGGGSAHRGRFVRYGASGRPRVAAPGVRGRPAPWRRSGGPDRRPRRGPCGRPRACRFGGCAAEVDQGAGVLEARAAVGERLGGFGERCRSASWTSAWRGARSRPRAARRSGGRGRAPRLRGCVRGLGRRARDGRARFWSAMRLGCGHVRSTPGKSHPRLDFAARAMGQWGAPYRREDLPRASAQLRP